MTSMWILMFFIILTSTIIQGDLFSSSTHLIQLLNTEVELAKKLEVYLKDEYDRLAQVEKFLNIIKSEIQQAEGKEESYISNPINSYLLVKHLTTEWNPIEKILPTGNLVKPFTSYFILTASRFD
ncbi:unnamed protein product [Rotaria sordida]|uniref:Prolyl 4-hydroxylase N-terminal domain-containing protein n=1 Tax=Rotaria sordida TaxID=392033 RepID=A0A814Z9M6_9BILA|nr:unnamed protein product [Rotaria sordida]